MTHNLEIEGMHCTCIRPDAAGRIAYILYPMDGLLDKWIERASEKYETAIAVLTGMDWQNVFSPWPATGVPKGSPDFLGQSPEFLRLLQQHAVPRIESTLGFETAPERTLVGVSMSGLFALWQWMLCDTFHNIASLSGSFWYEGFAAWISDRSVPAKSGRAFFLLGDKESSSNIRVFNTVGERTREIVSRLRAAGISTDFVSVPGNHYSAPVSRLDTAFGALFG